MEPRAAAPTRRLQVIEQLRRAGVPVSVLIAPVIPSINDNEIEALVATAKSCGAMNVNYVVLRLPHEVEQVFQDWLRTYFPLRYEKVMGKLESMFGGSAYRSAFGARMRGTGEIANLIQTRFKLASKKAGFDNEFLHLRTDFISAGFIAD